MIGGAFFGFDGSFETEEVEHGGEGLGGLLNHFIGDFDLRARFAFGSRGFDGDGVFFDGDGVFRRGIQILVCDRFRCRGNFRIPDFFILHFSSPEFVR